MKSYRAKRVAGFRPEIVRFSRPPAFKPYVLLSCGTVHQNSGLKLFEIFCSQAREFSKVQDFPNDAQVVPCVTHDAIVLSTV